MVFFTKNNTGVPKLHIRVKLKFHERDWVVFSKANTIWKKIKFRMPKNILQILVNRYTYIDYIKSILPFLSFDRDNKPFSGYKGKNNS